MTRIRTGALASTLGLALALALVGVRAQAAWADQPVAGGTELTTPVQSPYPPDQPAQPKWPITQVYPGNVLKPPTDPQPEQPDGPDDMANPTEHPDPPPPDGPDDLANPTEHPDPQPPPTTEPPAKPQTPGGATLIPTPERIDTGLGGTASSRPGLVGPTVMVLMVLMAATAVAVLMLASVFRRRARSSR